MDGRKIFKHNHTKLKLVYIIYNIASNILRDNNILRFYIIDRLILDSKKPS